MAGVLAVRWCAECRDEREFELPPCEDGHGSDCPDLACAQCGWAIVLGASQVEPVLAGPMAQPTAA